MKRLTPLLLLSLVFLAFGCRKPSPTNDNVNQNVTVVNTVTNTPSQTNVNQPPRATTQEELERLAAAVAERYGSYSNQSDYANLENLLFFMTTPLRRSTETFIATERAKRRDTSVYYGLTTRAVTVTVEALNDAGGTAIFRVTTQRQESIGTTSNAHSYSQDLRMTMKKEGGAWKVNELTWLTPQ